MNFVPGPISEKTQSPRRCQALSNCIGFFSTHLKKKCKTIDLDFLTYFHDDYNITTQTKQTDMMFNQK